MGENLAVSRGHCTSEDVATPPRLWSVINYLRFQNLLLEKFHPCPQIVEKCGNTLVEVSAPLSGVGGCHPNTYLLPRWLSGLTVCKEAEAGDPRYASQPHVMETLPPCRVSPKQPGPPGGSRGRPPAESLPRGELLAGGPAAPGLCL